MPLANAFYILKDKIKINLFYFIVILIFSILSFFTYERSKLWADVDKLQMYWAQISPNSPRAQSSIAAMLFDHGNIEEANNFLEEAIIRLPDSALLNIRLLMQKVYSFTAIESDFEKTAERLKQQPFDAQAIQGLRSLTEFVSDEEKASVYRYNVIDIIEDLEKNSHYNKNSIFLRLMPYLKAKLYLSMGDKYGFIYNYSLANERYADVEAGMMMVAEIGSMGFNQEALILLDQVESIYKNQNQKNLKRSNTEYDFEVMRVREILQSRINDQKD